MELRKLSLLFFAFLFILTISFSVIPDTYFKYLAYPNFPFKEKKDNYNKFCPKRMLECIEKTGTWPFEKCIIAKVRFSDPEVYYKFDNFLSSLRYNYPPQLISIEDTTGRALPCKVVHITPSKKGYVCIFRLESKTIGIKIKVKTRVSKSAPFVLAPRFYSIDTPLQSYFEGQSVALAQYPYPGESYEYQELYVFTLQYIVPSRPLCKDDKLQIGTIDDVEEIEVPFKIFFDPDNVGSLVFSKLVLQYRFPGYVTHPDCPEDKLDRAIEMLKEYYTYKGDISVHYGASSLIFDVQIVKRVELPNGVVENLPVYIFIVNQKKIDKVRKMLSECIDIDLTSPIKELQVNLYDLEKPEGIYNYKIPAQVTIRNRCEFPIPICIYTEVTFVPEDINKKWYGFPQGEREWFTLYSRKCDPNLLVNEMASGAIICNIPPKSSNKFTFTIYPPRAGYKNEFGDLIGKYSTEEPINYYLTAVVLLPFYFESPESAETKGPKKFDRPSYCYPNHLGAIEIEGIGPIPVYAYYKKEERKGPTPQPQPQPRPPVVKKVAEISYDIIPKNETYVVGASAVLYIRPISPDGMLLTDYLGYTCEVEASPAELVDINPKKDLPFIETAYYRGFRTRIKFLKEGSVTLTIRCYHKDYVEETQKVLNIELKIKSPGGGGGGLPIPPIPQNILLIFIFMFGSLLVLALFMKPAKEQAQTQ